MEEKSFVEHVREDPSDEVPRLVYADYLEDRGDPRGEFIRTQCELARLEVGNSARPGLVAREKELLNAHAQAWLAPLRELGAIGISARCFQRGLIERVKMQADVVPDNLEPLCAVAPALECIEVRSAADAIEELAALSMPPQVRSLDLSSNRLGPSEMAALVSAPWVGQIERLHLPFNALGDEGTRRLASVAWPRLRALALGQNGIGPRGTRVLATAAMPALRSLSLALNRIGAQGAGHLASSPHMANLEELDLAAADLQPQGALALARSTTLASLKRLNLRGNRITESAMRELAEVAPWELDYLDLRSNAAGEIAELQARFGEALVI